MGEKRQTVQGIVSLETTIFTDCSAESKNSVCSSDAARLKRENVLAEDKKKMRDIAVVLLFLEHFFAVRGWKKQDIAVSESKNN